jgi:formylglycine-generating enzyme required for sulfatase activity
MRSRWILLAVPLLLGGCLVDERCLSNQDCPSPKVCNSEGRCLWECTLADDCGTGFECVGHLCVPLAPREITCPDEMVKVNDLFCIDRYEASRADATADDPGTDESVATSRPGVLPWRLDDNNGLAAAACEAAGKRLCSPFEWELACRGPQMSVYGYGNTYDPAICNGIDTFGADDVKLVPTGAMDQCVNGWGIWDINGNLWEHVAEGDGSTVRGGAYNCIDSMSLHRCDYVPRTWVPSALGFRCCLTPEGSSHVEDVLPQPDVDFSDVRSDGSGCLDPDTSPIPDVPTDILPECTGDGECAHLLEPGMQCRTAVCLEKGTCALADADEGTPCDDADPCTVGDGCLRGACLPGEETLVCDDVNPCTDDACVPPVGCQFTPNAAACSDGDPCTLGDLCVEGLCKPGPDEPICDDENPCTDDACVPQVGCQFTPNDEPCDDANPCTDPDLCVDGVCVPGEVICSCVEDADCPNDENLCNGELICDTNQWPYVCIVKPGSPIVCPPSEDPCKKNVCAPATGQCGLLPVADGKPCNDNNDCTTDDSCKSGTCAGGTNVCQCESDNDCLAFEDGDLCNGTLGCDKSSFPYACKVLPATVVTCTPPEDPCWVAQCQPLTGQCLDKKAPDGTPCDDGDPCNGADHCTAGVCVSGTQVLCSCPADMVPVNNQFCLDRYEASRPDATAGYMGADTSHATSRVGVIPWFPVTWSQAKAACEAAEKRLCTTAEINLACFGAVPTTYTYGNDYSATICNGIDAFCYCDQPPCSELEECPYPHCFAHSPDGEYGAGCGAYFHVTPTGTFADCINDWGAFDINGNVWELVDTGNGESWYTGGAYNCSNSEYLHQCGGMFQNISAKGFRCCKEIAL